MIVLSYSMIIVASYVLSRRKGASSKYVRNYRLHDHENEEKKTLINKYYLNGCDF